MKLYCVEIKKGEQVSDVQHILANDNKEVHTLMDEFIAQCKEYELEENGYSFFEVNTVDGLDLHNLLKIYERRDGQIKVKELM